MKQRPVFPPQLIPRGPYPVLALLSEGYPRVQGRLLTCYAPVRHCTQGPKSPFSYDLHVLSTPPAFVLSQDQTLRCRRICLTSEGRILRPVMFADFEPHESAKNHGSVAPRRFHEQVCAIPFSKIEGAIAPRKGSVLSHAPGIVSSEIRWESSETRSRPG